MRPNVEFWVELPKKNQNLAKSHFQKETRDYVQKTAPDKSQREKERKVSKMKYLTVSLTHFHNTPLAISYKLLKP